MAPPSPRTGVEVDVTGLPPTQARLWLPAPHFGGGGVAHVVGEAGGERGEGVIGLRLAGIGPAAEAAEGQRRRAPNPTPRRR